MDNTVLVTGNLGYEPETRHFESGSTLTTFSVGVYNGKDKPAIWLKINCWNEVAEALPVLDKGTRVCVTGRLAQPEAWIGKADNQPKCSIVVNAESVALRPWQERGQKRQQQPARQDTGAGRSIEDYDDVPF